MDGPDSHDSLQMVEKAVVSSTFQRDISELLDTARFGEHPAVNELFDAVYIELRRVARSFLHELRNPIERYLTQLGNHESCGLTSLRRAPSNDSLGCFEPLITRDSVSHKLVRLRGADLP